MILLTLEGNTVKTSQEFTPQNPSFVFFLIGQRIYYINSAIGDIWVTDAQEIAAGKDHLCQEHREIVLRFLNRPSQ